jgi:uncharacterized membrane protein
MKASAGRQAYLDWVRGVAVLIMIEAHVFDSWTRPTDRSQPLFGYAMLIGGFGAPMFLFLAGLAAVLSAESKYRRTNDFPNSWRAAEKRGWQLFALAFVFRIQSYVLGGFQNALGLLKVDILNVMGPAMAVAASTGRRFPRKVTRALWFAVAALGISLVTPVVRTAGWLDWLPDPVEWYVRPSPGRTNFTLFPWAGFLFAGAAIGTAVDHYRLETEVRRLQVWLATGGALLIWLAYAGSFLPSIYRQSDFWTSSPAFYLIRTGLLIVILPLAFTWEHAPWRHKLNLPSPLEELGRASLFVYWVHVELVYGVFSTPLRRSLSLEQTMGAYILFTLFLWGLVRLKHRLMAARPVYLTDNKSVI